MSSRPSSLYAASVGGKTLTNEDSAEFEKVNLDSLDQKSQETIKAIVGNGRLTNLTRPRDLSNEPEFFASVALGYDAEDSQTHDNPPPDKWWIHGNPGPFRDFALLSFGKEKKTGLLRRPIPGQATEVIGYFIAGYRTFDDKVSTLYSQATGKSDASKSGSLFARIFAPTPEAVDTTISSNDLPSLAETLKEVMKDMGQQKATRTGEHWYNRATSYEVFGQHLVQERDTLPRSKWKHNVQPK